MRLQDFGYNLPQDLIAQEPLKKRDEARLMVVDRKASVIYHDFFYNLCNYLPDKSQIVINNSKVIPARLIGRKSSTGAKIEIFLLRRIDDYVFEVLMRPMKRLKQEDEVEFDGVSLKATVVDKQKRLIRFNKKNVSSDVEKIGHMPLPPYIKRADKKEDRINYQTVFAKAAGSVAAPTAGLHFSKKLLKQIKSKGHTIDAVTLHINYATFKAVECEDIRNHHMHSEQYMVAKKVFDNIAAARKKGRKVVAVGTTSLRVLETLAQTQELKGETNIFIYPGFSFKMTDILITNFHLPFSTLLMLVYAFAGADLMKKAYSTAVKEQYRFFSYGDAMIII